MDVNEPSRSSSLGPSWFRDLYGATADPWGLEGSWYEDRKRAVVLAALPDPSYRRAFEPGCANGALTELLAPRCGELLAHDVAPEAVAATRERCRGLAQVRVEEGSILDAWPAGPFDLVVLSELVYYFDARDRATIRRAALDALGPGGTLLAVHWTRAAPDHPTTGDEVHDELGRLDGLERVAGHVEADFRLDVLARTPPRAASVAERTGLR